jgi:hypothetical protein
VRVRNRRNHALGHLVGRHPKLGLGAGDHDVQSAEQILALIQGTSSSMSTSIPMAESGIA